MFKKIAIAAGAIGAIAIAYKLGERNGMEAAQNMIEAATDAAETVVDTVTETVETVTDAVD